MTIREALDQRIYRVRLPEWNQPSYLELPRVGPWAHLYDPWSSPDGALPILVTLLLQDSCDRYEAIE